jgi:DNA polymerase-3 subunit beta
MSSRICSRIIFATVTTECPAAVTTPGKATVPAQKMLNYLKFLPGGKLSMKLLANHQMQITSGHSCTKMPGLAPNSFPPAPSSVPHRFVSVRVV